MAVRTGRSADGEPGVGVARFVASSDAIGADWGACSVDRAGMDFVENRCLLGSCCKPVLSGPSPCPRTDTVSRIRPCWSTADRPSAVTLVLGLLRVDWIVVEGSAARNRPDQDVTSRYCPPAGAFLLAVRPALPCSPPDCCFLVDDALDVFRPGRFDESADLSPGADVDPFCFCSCPWLFCGALDPDDPERGLESAPLVPGDT